MASTNGNGTKTIDRETSENIDKVLNKNPKETESGSNHKKPTRKKKDSSIQKASQAIDEQTAIAAQTVVETEKLADRALYQLGAKQADRDTVKVNKAYQLRTLQNASKARAKNIKDLAGQYNLLDEYIDSQLDETAIPTEENPEDPLEALGDLLDDSQTSIPSMPSFSIFDD